LLDRGAEKILLSEAGISKWLLPGSEDEGGGADSSGIVGSVDG
jgi:hypothetical protein